MLSKATESFFFLYLWRELSNNCLTFGWICSESVSTDGNTTTSVLNLMPTVNDDNALLICRAQNVRLSHQYIEDGWELQVYCK